MFRVASVIAIGAQASNKAPPVKGTAIPNASPTPVPNHKFSAFGGVLVLSGPACSPVGILPLWLGLFGERACRWGVSLLVESAFAGGKSCCHGKLTGAPTFDF